MASVTRARQYKFEEFCALNRDDQKADLLHGVIYIASPASLEANNLCVWLVTLIRNFLDTQKLGGQVFVSHVAFRLDDRNGPEQTSPMWGRKAQPFCSVAISKGPLIWPSILFRR
jgi:hypothetical protein